MFAMIVLHLRVHEEEVLPAVALHAGEHVLAGAALGLPHLGQGLDHTHPF